MEDSANPSQYNQSSELRRYELAVVLVAALIYLGCAISPPGLMDDVDSVQAQIARTMLDSGDWVTARLNGVPYLEKSPLIYWLIAISYSVFGVHDWAARLPVALSAVALAWLMFRMGAWAFSARVGLYAGLVTATCIGLFLFTRIQIPDVMLTLTIALAMWGFLRAFDEREPRPGLWIHIAWASVATGLLLKGLIAALFPAAAAFLFLLFSRRLFDPAAWKQLRLLTGIPLMLAIAAPWHVLATLRNPPYLDFTFRIVPGDYRGFFWFYFMNEHVLRFLNLRHPRDYNTVPRHLFWLLHLLWLFPWSVYFGAVAGLSFKPVDRAGGTRLLCLCLAGFVLIFFTFSTTQEYYSMPCYPALALLVACAMDKTLSDWPRRLLLAIAAAALAAILYLIVSVWNLPAPGDISRALASNPDAYTLSLGHMGDLTIASFAYLRTPLMVAATAFALGLIGLLKVRRGPALACILAAMMVIFLHAARIAMVTFDPFLGSKTLAQALQSQASGTLIVDNQYYAFSSVFFYTNSRALLLNGRVNNLEYGSYAPGAPRVFISEADLVRLWKSSDRFYLCVEGPRAPGIRKLVGESSLRLVRESGGKFLFSNQ